MAEKVPTLTPKKAHGRHLPRRTNNAKAGALASISTRTLLVTLPGWACAEHHDQPPPGTHVIGGARVAMARPHRPQFPRVAAESSHRRGASEEHPHQPPHPTTRARYWRRGAQIPKRSGRSRPHAGKSGALATPGPRSRGYRPTGFDGAWARAPVTPTAKAARRSPGVLLRGPPAPGPAVVPLAQGAAPGRFGG